MSTRHSDLVEQREREGRERKVDAIVVGISGAGFGPAEVARWGDKQWVDLTKTIGVRRPGPLTRRIVVERLAGGSHDRALCPTCGMGDPEGVDGPPQRFGHDGPCSR